MKVLMLTTNASLMDGINRHILAISGGLVREGVEVGVCIVQPRGELAEELEKVGVKVYSLGCANGHSFKILPRFRKVMRGFKPDVVHVHVMALMERFILAWLFPSVKKVQTIHGISDPVVKKTLRMRIEDFLCHISPISHVLRCYVSKGVQKAREGSIVYNPIDIREMEPRKKLRELIGVAPETKVIGTACRIAQVKNPQAFVRVMRGVIERMPEVHAVVIGDGEPELMAELKDIAAGCEHIHFLGYRSDARQLISECDCFVMTSAREGMPTAMLEAMASGVPVAFWKGEGGLVDLAELNEKEGPLGVIAEQGDEAGLVDGIVEGISASMGENGRIVVSRHFALRTVIVDLTAMYSNSIKETYA